MKKSEMINEINDVLNMIRPYIQNDGGDIEFVELSDDGVVKVRFLGACVGCGLADVTLYNGVEQSLIDEVPGVIGVDLVQDNW